MKPNIISRTITILIFGVLMGVAMYHGEMKNAALGRDEYLKRDAVYFDKRYADPLPISTAIARGIATAGLSICVYELVSFGIFKLLPKNDRRSRKRSDRQF